jgi:hypothetical protein
MAGLGDAGEGHAASSYGLYNRLTQDEIKPLSTDDELQQKTLQDSPNVSRRHGWSGTYHPTGNESRGRQDKKHNRDPSLLKCLHTRLVP